MTTEKTTAGRHFPLATVNEFSTVLGVRYSTAAAYAREPGFPPIADRRGRLRLYHLRDVVGWYLARELNARLGEEEDGGEAPLDLSRERARVARLTAEAKALELSQRRGEVIEVDAVAAVLESAVAIARGVLLETHARCAGLRPDLPREVIDEIRLAHHEACQALADAPLPAELGGEEAAA